MKKLILILTLVLTSPFAFANSSGDVNELDSDKKLNEIFNVQGDVLENTLKKQPSLGDWKFTNLIMDFGLSGGGRLGILPFEGISAFRAFWSYQGNEISENNEKIIQLNNSMTVDEVLESADYLAYSLKDIIEIPDPKDFKKRVRKLFKDFYVIAHSFHENTNSPWRAKRLYFERSISESGDIIKDLFGSAQIQFRVMWELEGKRSSLPPSLDDRKNKLNKPLNKLVNDIATDLEIVAKEVEALHPVSARNFKIGIGISDKWDLAGIVKLKPKAMAMIEFERKKGSDFDKMHIRPNGDIVFFDNDLPEVELNDLIVQGKLISQNNSDTIYKVDRKELRKGMKFGFKMSQRIFEQAENAKRKHWAINRVDVSMQMSSKLKETKVPNLRGHTTAIISVGM